MLYMLHMSPPLIERSATSEVPASSVARRDARS